MPLNRLNVGQRIFFGFGLLIVLSLAQGSFSILQFGEVNQETRHAVALAGNLQRVLEATHDLPHVAQRAWQTR